MTLLALAQLGRGVVPVDEPLLRADDEGFLRGRAIFETLRVYGGVPFELAAHLDRFERSARHVRLEPPPRDAFVELVDAALAESGAVDAVLRLLWTPTTGLVLVSPLPEDLDELRARGLRLTIATWAASELRRAKSTSYADNIAAQVDAARAGADDALLVGPDGIVFEAPTSNVWFREGGTLHTPSLELPILAGVTRAVVMRLSERPVEEGVYDLERLLAAEEVFLTASVREVMPVVRVGGREFERGPAAADLQQSLRRYAEAG
jgi:branched-subunit amino acid aminotransferase/4-amino-4-deoxychorismate lyase